LAFSKGNSFLFEMIWMVLEEKQRTTPGRCWGERGQQDRAGSSLSSTVFPAASFLSLLTLHLAFVSLLYITVNILRLQFGEDEYFSFNRFSKAFCWEL
jgi:hypothetical protein